MADSAPLLPAEKPERRGDVVIALPDRDDLDSQQAPPVADAASGRGWVLRRAAAAVMVLAALAVAGHCYRLYYSPETAARLWGQEWKWSQGGASSSFLLPLYPKKPGVEAEEGSTAALPERFVL
jgi:hypothetical protein